MDKFHSLFYFFGGKKMKKLLFLLMVIFLFLPTIYGENIDQLNADDIYNLNVDNQLIDDIESVNNDESNIVQSNFQNVSNYDQLYSAISNIDTSQSDFTIYLNEGVYKVTNPIIWDEERVNLIIEGNNNIIDVNGKHLLDVSRYTKITLKNLTIINAHLDKGTGSAIYSRGELNLDSVIFKDNSMNGGRGAAVFNDEKGLLNVSNCQFIGNKVNANNNLGAWAGAIYNYGNAYINNCSFIDNYAEYGGAAIFNNASGFLDINDSYFEDNKASYGVIGNAGTAIINGTLFNNHAGFFSSGILYNFRDSILYFNQNVVMNTSSHYAGFVRNERGTIYMDSNMFINNTVSSSGGVIISSGVIFSSNNYFAGNSAQKGGVALIDSYYPDDDDYEQIPGVINFLNDVFYDNKATTGGLAYSYGNITMFNVTMSFMDANEGATIYNYGNCNINASSIYSNTASMGVIYNNKRLNMDNCFIINNTAEKAGGVLYNYGYAVAILNGNMLLSNKVDEEGYVLNNRFYKANKGQLILRNNIFYNNTFEKKDILFGVNGDPINHRENFFFHNSLYTITPEISDFDLTEKEYVKNVTVEVREIYNDYLVDSTLRITNLNTSKTFDFILDESGSTLIKFGRKDLVLGENSLVLTYRSVDGWVIDNITKFTVNVLPLDYKLNSTIELDSMSDSNIYVGDNVTVSYKLSDAESGFGIPDALVVISIGNYSQSEKTNGEGIASITYEPDAAGEMIVSAVFEGNDYYLKSVSTNNNVLNVIENSSLEIPDIQVNDSFINVGETVNITVELPVDAKGNVSIDVDGENHVEIVNNGIAVISISNLEEGNYSFIVYYSGDDKYSSAVSNAFVMVIPIVIPKENATIVIDAPEITEGENATITVVIENATGNVTISIDNIIKTDTLDNGKVIFVIEDLNEGNYTIDVSYSGDDNYNNNTASDMLTVNAKNVPIPSKVNVTIDAHADDIIEGENATITVILPNDATGNVSANVDNVTYFAAIGEGKAIITVPGLIENSTAFIFYGGDDRYNNASTTVDIIVIPNAVSKDNLTLEATASPIVVGDDAVIVISGFKDATGNVIASVNGIKYTVPIENSAATIIIPNLTAGNHTVTVVYRGDNNYDPVIMDVNVVVADKEEKSEIITLSNVTKYFGGSERFVVNITDSEGNPVANKSVIIVVNGQKYDRTTKADGTTSIGLSLNSGVYNATVTVDNKTINSVVTVLSTVNGTNVVKVYRNATQYYATFRDSEGNYLKEGTVVTFNINGVMYERKISGSEGLAKLNLNLEQGTYVLTAMNPQTGENAANNITIISRLIENKDITKFYRNATQYTVKVIGDDGNPVGAGESITFNINGVFYTRQTNASGIVKLNLNLQPGDYIITAEYKNCKVSNNIKVLPVLSAEDITMKYRDGTKFIAKLVDGQGNPYAGQSIQFNINGVFYNRVTDSNGQAKLNINLQAGEYIITSSYNGANIANTVKVNA